jgi:hypothetical protein
MADNVSAVFSVSRWIEKREKQELENPAYRLIRHFFRGLQLGLRFAPTLQTFRTPQI